MAANAKEPPWPRSWPPFWRAVLHIAIATGIGNLGVAAGFVGVCGHDGFWSRNPLYSSHFGRILIVSIVSLPLVLSAVISSLLVRPRRRDVLALTVALLVALGVSVAPHLAHDNYSLGSHIVAMGLSNAPIGYPVHYPLRVVVGPPGVCALVVGVLGAFGLVTSLAPRLLMRVGQRALLVLDVVLILASLGTLLFPGRATFREECLWPVVVMAKFVLIGCLFARIGGRADRHRIVTACATGFLIYCLGTVFGPLARRAGLIWYFDVGGRHDLVNLFIVSIQLGLPFPLAYAVTARMLVSATQEKDESD